MCRPSHCLCFARLPWTGFYAIATPILSGITSAIVSHSYTVSEVMEAHTTAMLRTAGHILPTLALLARQQKYSRNHNTRSSHRHLRDMPYGVSRDILYLLLGTAWLPSQPPLLCPSGMDDQAAELSRRIPVLTRLHGWRRLLRTWVSPALSSSVSSLMLDTGSIGRKACYGG